MQANQKPVIWTVVVATVILLVAGFFAVSSVNSNLRLAGEKLDSFEVDEQAIANAIVAGIVMPEMPTLPEFDTGKLDELWQGIYGDDVEDLEDEAFIKSVYQFLDDNNYLKYVNNATYNLSNIDSINSLFNNLEELYNSSSLEGLYFEDDDDLFDFLVDEYEDESEGEIRVQFIKEYEGKREIEVFNLGLDDEDDREIELSSVIRVKIFTDEHDDTEYEFDKVYINSVVTSDDGELEAEISYSL